MCKGLKPKSVLESYVECKDEIDSSNFGKEIFFDMTCSFFNMNPNITSKILGMHGESGPGFTTLGITTAMLDNIFLNSSRVACRSYAVLLRNERARPTTKPRTVKRIVATPTRNC